MSAVVEPACLLGARRRARFNHRRPWSVELLQLWHRRSGKLCRVSVRQRASLLCSCNFYFKTSLVAQQTDRVSDMWRNVFFQEGRGQICSRLLSVLLMSDLILMTTTERCRQCGLGLWIDECPLSEATVYCQELWDAIALIYERY